jgi:hypothetical protein
VTGQIRQNGTPSPLVSVVSKMKPSYASALSANAADFPPPPEPSPLFPPIRTAPAMRWGSFKIDYDDIIYKAFTIPPPKPTIAWVMLRNIFYDHPAWIEVSSPPHQNSNDDALHLSLRVFASEKRTAYHTIHINGRLEGNGSEFGAVTFWNETMEVQVGVKCNGEKTFTQIREMVADWTPLRRPRHPRCEKCGAHRELFKHCERCGDDKSDD